MNCPYFPRRRLNEAKYLADFLRSPDAHRGVSKDRPASSGNRVMI